MCQCQCQLPVNFHSLSGEEPVMTNWSEDNSSQIPPNLPLPEGRESIPTLSKGMRGDFLHIAMVCIDDGIYERKTRNMITLLCTATNMPLICESIYRTMA